jgi:hypothetical protein
MREKWVAYNYAGGANVPFFGMSAPLTYSRGASLAFLLQLLTCSSGGPTQGRALGVSNLFGT